MEWPPNWQPIMPEAKQALEAELKREVRQGHPLYSVPVEAIARRDDCDDVLFIETGLPLVAVVHLSYGEETNALWPLTQIFGSLQEWKGQQ